MQSSLIKLKIKKKKNCNIKSQLPNQIIVGRTWRFVNYPLVNYLFDVVRSINVKYLMIVLLFVIVNTFLIVNSLERRTMGNICRNSKTNVPLETKITKSEVENKETALSEPEEKVNQFILRETENLKQVCSGEIGATFTWTAPMEGSKTLEFTQFQDIENQLGWKLTKVNGEDVFEFDRKSSLYFTMQDATKFYGNIIFLDSLKPTYPVISGVDFLQVVMTLCHVCEQEIHILDASDLSIPYHLVYEKNYYEYTIKGPFPISKINKENNFHQDTFLTCTSNWLNENSGQILHKTIIYKRILLNLRRCSKQNLDLQNCPLGYQSIGEVLHKTIFPQCVMENIGNLYRPVYLKFQFKELKSLYTLMTKLPPSSPAISVIDPSKKNCPEVHNYDILESNLLETKIEKSFEDAFKFCFTQVTDKKITAELILKNVMRCVSQNLDFLWKHQCE